MILIETELSLGEETNDNNLIKAELHFVKLVTKHSPS